MLSPSARNPSQSLANWSRNQSCDGGSPAGVIPGCTNSDSRSEDIAVSDALSMVRSDCVLLKFLSSSRVSPNGDDALLLAVSEKSPVSSI